MRMLRLAFTPRLVVYTLCILLTAALLLATLAYPPAFDIAVVPLAVFASLTVLGTHDLIQTRHSVLRNYPISAHLRFLLEEIRPEMRQYFFEGEKDGAPFSRDKRAVVYQRAKMVLDKRPFGTQYDVYAEGFEWVRHSIMPRPLVASPFRVRIGGPDCRRPYDASIFNISAMSFGALSPNAIRRSIRAPRPAISPMILGRAACPPTTARTAATLSGNSARGISAPAIPTARFRRNGLQIPPHLIRSRWSS